MSDEVPDIHTAFKQVVSEIGSAIVKGGKSVVKGFFGVVTWIKPNESGKENEKQPSITQSAARIEGQKAQSWRESNILPKEEETRVFEKLSQLSEAIKAKFGFTTTILKTPIEKQQPEVEKWSYSRLSSEETTQAKTTEDTLAKIISNWDLTLPREIERDLDRLGQSDEQLSGIRSHYREVQKTQPPLDDLSHPLSLIRSEVDTLPLAQESKAEVKALLIASLMAQSASGWKETAVTTKPAVNLPYFEASLNQTDLSEPEQKVIFNVYKHLYQIDPKLPANSKDLDHFMQVRRAQMKEIVVEMLGPDRSENVLKLI